MALEITAYGPQPISYGFPGGADNGQDLGTQSLAIGAASADSDPLPDGTAFVVLQTTEACRVAFGAAGVEASNDGTPLSRLLRANSDYRFAARPGLVVAAIQAAP